jgi:type I restriction enzyme S subunit
MSEWKEYRLGNAPLSIIDGDRGKNYPNQNEFQSSGHCLFLSTKNVRLTGFDFSECQFISKERDELLRKGKLSRYDLVLTTRGTIGNLGFFSGNVEFENVRINSGMVIIRPNQELLLPKFNFYIFRYLQKDFLKFTTGSAQPQLPIRDLNQIEIKIPSLRTQTAIAEILSSLDDKIELNNKINKELETLAQTLFKQWFIDFEFPNENGEPYKSSGGEMVESELGEIPKGWEVVELSNLLTVKYGKDHKHLSDGIYPLYGSGGIMRYVEKPLYQHNSILIPRKGTLSNLFYLEEPFWSVDTMFYTEIHNPIFGKYLFHCIKALDIASMNVGSAVPSMTTKVLNELRILNPYNLVIQEFDSVLSAFYNSVNQNKKETEDLTILRDTLLPKLISGELEINEISH